MLTAIGVLLFAIFSATPQKDVIWLDPIQLARSNRPTKMLHLRNKLAAWAAPVWNRFHPPTQMLMSSIVVLVPPEVVNQPQLSGPVRTNIDGTRLRVLTPAETQTLPAFFEHAEKNSIVTASRVTTLNGRRAQTFSGGLPRLGTNAGLPSCSLDVRSKILRKQILVTAGITLTEFVRVPGNTILDVKTNIYGAFRVLTLNTGGFFLLSGRTNADGKIYGIIMSAAAVDPAGNIINL